eukprot:UN09208
MTGYLTSIGHSNTSNDLYD